MGTPTNRKQSRTALILILAVIGVIAVLLCSFLYQRGLLDQNFGSPVSPQNAPLRDGELRVHFLDTDQSECILIQYQDKAILIDAANQGYGSLISGYLWDEDVTALDLLVLTHPHSDHIGSAADILDHFPVREVLLPDIPTEFLSDIPLYGDLLEKIHAQGCQITYGQPNTAFVLDEKVMLSILGPLKDYGEDLNNQSLVTKLSYDDISFLFTGDMEALAESDLMEAGVDLSATVLKIGHHGSHTASSPAFLSAVHPRYAVIQCGRNNDYGHPHKATRESLQEREIKVYRTDLDGDIVFTTDGTSVTVTTQYGLD